MVFGLTHVIVPVRSLESARVFYVDQLGLPRAGEGVQTLDLDAGGTRLRLAQTPDPAAPVTVRLQTTSIDAVLARLAAVAASPVIIPVRTPELELVAEVCDPDGNRLVLWRPLSEDEYEEPPRLPLTRVWSREARTLMEALLARVPALFRDLARAGAVAEAEHLADTPAAVDVEHVVRAYIRATPRLVRARVREPLRAHGFEPDRYRVDFDV